MSHFEIGGIGENRWNTRGSYLVYKKPRVQSTSEVGLSKLKHKVAHGRARVAFSKFSVNEKVDNKVDKNNAE